MRNRPPAVSTAIQLLLVALAPQASAQGISTGLEQGRGDVLRGKSISERHCSRCHVVGDYNKFGGIGSTPSFQLLANAFPDYRERVETFFVRRPHPAFLTIKGFGRPMPELPPNATPIELPLDAVADILAFVETLRRRRTP